MLTEVYRRLHRCASRSRRAPISRIASLRHSKNFLRKCVAAKPCLVASGVRMLSRHECLVGSSTQSGSARLNRANLVALFHVTLRKLPPREVWRGLENREEASDESRENTMGD